MFAAAAGVVEYVSSVARAYVGGEHPLWAKAPPKRVEELEALEKDIPWKNTDKTKPPEHGKNYGAPTGTLQLTWCKYCHAAKTPGTHDGWLTAQFAGKGRHCDSNGHKIAQSAGDTQVRRIGAQARKRGPLSESACTFQTHTTEGEDTEGAPVSKRQRTEEPHWPQRHAPGSQSREEMDADFADMKTGFEDVRERQSVIDEAMESGEIDVYEGLFQSAELDRDRSELSIQQSNLATEIVGVHELDVARIQSEAKAEAKAEAEALYRAGGSAALQDWDCGTILTLPMNPGGWGSTFVPSEK
jgi:hypothetical protein